MSARLAITLVCAIVGIAVAVILGRGVRAGPSVAFFEPDEAALLSARDEAGRGVLGPVRAFEDSTLKRFAIPPELARKIFPLDHPFNRYDPDTYFAHRPGLDARCEFAEHPDGEWRMHTNSLGMRRDEEVSEVKPDLRVLVAGDSHADGLCNNAEGFPARLEAELERRHAGRTIEVLNASRGGYGPYNYLGVLEKFIDLEPDVFLVWFTSSNDLTGVLMLARMFRGEKAPQEPPDAKRREEQARSAGGGAFSAGYHALSYFARFPEQLDFAMGACREVLAEIARLCEHHGVRPLVLYLPPPICLPWEVEVREAAEVRELLELGAEDLALADVIKARFLATCAEIELPVLDLEPLFAEGADAFFYRSDLHLNPHGQARVAGALVPLLDEAPELATAR
jgi:hypothetical protein